MQTLVGTSSLAMALFFCCLMASCSDDNEQETIIVTPTTGEEEEEDNNTEEPATTALTFTNPIMYADMPDPSVVRVGDDYYMVSTTMQFCPAGVVLHSKDLVGWEIVGHVSESIGTCPAANLEECTLGTVGGFDPNEPCNHYHNHRYDSTLNIHRDDIYAQGWWAASLAYKDGYYYCLWNVIQDDMSYISRTKDPAGEWEIISSTNPIFYDSSLFFDDDGTAYVCRAHSEKIFRLPASLDLNGAEEIYDFSADRGIYNDTEGYHMFKINGYYYITMVYWLNWIGSCVVLRSEHVDGPYDVRVALSGYVLDSAGSRVTTGGVAQGRAIDSSDDGNGNYYGVFAANMGTCARAPVVANMSFDADGMLVFGNSGTSVSEVLPAPVQKYGYVSPCVVAKSDDFSDQKLSPVWEWNHNPDNDCWSLTANPGHLRLIAGHTSYDFFHARNTLTQRTLGPQCTGVITLDASHMNDGDCAGLGMLQYRAGVVGIRKQNGKYYVYMNKGIQNYGRSVTDDLTDGDYCGEMRDFETREFFGDPSTLALRINANFPDKVATFSYQQDGVWQTFDETLTMTYELANFSGNRLAIFNYATETVGGYVDIDSFDITQR